MQSPSGKLVDSPEQNLRTRTNRSRRRGDRQRQLIEDVVGFLNVEGELQSGCSEIVKFIDAGHKAAEANHTLAYVLLIIPLF